MTEAERLTMRARALVLALLLVGGFILLSSYGAQRASALPLLWQKCPSGEAAGQCQSPRGIVTNPDSGNVYVVDRINRRINEFSPWGTFVKAWGWGVANGASELQQCGPGATSPTSTCQRGLNGGGAGQLTGPFSGPQGIAIDSANNLYVYESKGCISGSACDTEVHTNRVQKFTPDGDFILMFGKEANLTAVAEREAQEAASEPVTVTPQEENVCTAASGDTCGPGEQGSGDGEFGTGPLSAIDPRGSFISVGPGDKVWVGGQERIQIFDREGNFEEEISIPGKMVRALAVDVDGHAFAVYASGVEGSKDDVVKLNPSGTAICQASVEDPRALATDAQGRLYVAAGREGPFEDVTIHRFSAGCVEDQAFAFTVTGLESADSTTGIATSSACNIEGNVYYTNEPPTRSFVRAYRPRPNPVLCPPEDAPPTIESQYTVSATDTSAVVQAEINPHFWPDTTYYVQWGAEECRNDESACEETELLPGAPLAGEDDVGVKTAGVTIEGLNPDTTYFYRFVSSSGGGGPVFGIDPDGDGPEEASPEEGLGNSFTTFPTPSPFRTNCPNQSLREAGNGLSTRLPNCRAYEMVSPVDKEGGEIRVMINSASDPAGLFQGSEDGERMTYSSYRAFGDPESAPYTSQYMAARGSSGWATDAISPPQIGSRLLDTEVLESSYKGFSEDLCNGWILQMYRTPIAPEIGALSDYANLLRRSNCPPTEGAYEAITKVAPEWEESAGNFEPTPTREFIPSFQGASADGSHTVFRSVGHLTSNASPCTPAEKTANGNSCRRQVYDFHEGNLSLVCVLPGAGGTHQGNCSLGTGFEAEFKNTFNSVYRAISADGSRIFWTGTAGDNLGGAGKLYVRVNGTTTNLISNTPAWFWTAAVDGSKALYTVVSDVNGVEGSLKQYDLGSKSSANIAGETSGVMGASDDATKMYFSSKEVLTTEANPEGEEAQAGEENLYYYDSASDSYQFVGTLAADDVNARSSAVNFIPMRRTSRISPDGRFAAFTSSAPLTGADNADLESGEADDEVFLYDAQEKKLRCVSCANSGARPRGNRVIVNDEPIGPWIASEIPGWPTQTHPSRALSDDGSHLFFNSTSQLTLADTNDRQDVYEWQPGADQLECTEKGAELFLKKEGGCLSMISAPNGPEEDSSFLDASSNGRDAFFTTEASLVPQDPGGVDVYDAREGGGFMPPPEPGPICTGDACQSPPAPPANDQTPSSATFQGPESKPQPPKPKCKKGKVRRKGKCVKKHKKAKHKAAKGGKR